VVSRAAAESAAAKPARAPREALPRGLHRTGAYETEAFYTHRLSLLNRLLARTTKRMLGDHFGLTQMEWRILVQLEHRSPARLADIHERTLCPKPQISASLPGLVRKGLVVREGNDADARAPYFALTEEGLRLYRAVMRLSRKRQKMLESALGAAKRDAFAAALDRLTELLLAESAEALFTASPAES
jgi:DNA-binding MarR family transcriptional regulator